MKHRKRCGATRLYREIDVCELDRIRGGHVIVTDPGPGPSPGPRDVVGDPQTNTVVVTPGGPGPTGPT